MALLIGRLLVIAASTAAGLMLAPSVGIRPIGGAVLGAVAGVVTVGLEIAAGAAPLRPLLWTTGGAVAGLLAVVSSLRNRPLPERTVVFGEVGLTGEVRPVQRGQERLKEAAKLGFTRAIIPAANKPRQPIEGLEVIAVERVVQALE